MQVHKQHTKHLHGRELVEEPLDSRDGIQRSGQEAVSILEAVNWPEKRAHTYYPKMFG